MYQECNQEYLKNSEIDHCGNLPDLYPFHGIGIPNVAETNNLKGNRFS